MSTTTSPVTDVAELRACDEPAAYATTMQAAPAAKARVVGGGAKVFIAVLRSIAASCRSSKARSRCDARDRYTGWFSAVREIFVRESPSDRDAVS